MRRVRLGFTSLVVAISLFAAGAAPASAAVPEEDQRAWIQWAFGDSDPLLLDDTACGEMVGDTFFMTVKNGAGTRRLHCEVSAGTPLLVTPGGAIAWAPTDGNTANQLFHTLWDGYLAPIVLESVRVKVDGVLLPRGPLTISDVYDLPLQPGNLIQIVDPAVTGDTARIIYGFWFNRIGPLEPGIHKIVAADKFRGLGRVRTVFRFTVTPS